MDARCWISFICFVLFVVLLLCLVSPVWNCNHLFGEGAGCFVFHYENTPIQINGKFHLQILNFFIKKKKKKKKKKL